MPCPADGLPPGGKHPDPARDSAARHQPSARRARSRSRPTTIWTPATARSTRWKCRSRPMAAGSSVSPIQHASAPMPSLLQAGPATPPAPSPVQMRSPVPSTNSSSTSRSPQKTPTLTCVHIWRSRPLAARSRSPGPSIPDRVIPEDHARSPHPRAGHSHQPGRGCSRVVNGAIAFSARSPDGAERNPGYGLTLQYTTCSGLSLMVRRRHLAPSRTMRPSLETRQEALLQPERNRVQARMRAERVGTQPNQD